MNPFDPRNWPAVFAGVFGIHAPRHRPDSPGFANAMGATRAFQAKLSQMTHDEDLNGLQAAFDNMRNALKQAFPFGGPNGPVG